MFDDHQRFQVYNILILGMDTKFDQIDPRKMKE